MYTYIQLMYLLVIFLVKYFIAQTASDTKQPISTLQNSWLDFSKNLSLSRRPNFQNPSPAPCFFFIILFKFLWFETQFPQASTTDYGEAIASVSDSKFETWSYYICTTIVTCNAMHKK